LDISDFWSRGRCVVVKPVLALGWDVGGWMGAKHGWAMCTLTEDGRIEWPSPPVELRIGPTGGFDLGEIVRRLSGSNEPMGAGQRVVLAIDAPLGFPIQFRKLLDGERVELPFPTREIDSELAYRETDRHVHATLGKKPLSASFDKLGNNASVAMVHVRRWCEADGFSVRPLTDEGASDREIIEVYPALAKDPRSREAKGRLSALLPPEVRSGTDAYDAAICALHAARFGAGQAVDSLPALVGPARVTEVIKEEGWIYYFPPDDLDFPDKRVTGS